MTDHADTHEKLVKACTEYLKYQDRFINKGSDEAGAQARNWLSELRRLCSLRRVEIQIERTHRRKLRNGKNGRPKNITIGSY